MGSLPLDGESIPHLRVRSPVEDLLDRPGNHKLDPDSLFLGPTWMGPVHKRHASNIYGSRSRFHNS